MFNKDNIQTFGSAAQQVQKDSSQLTASGYSRKKLVLLWGLIVIGYFLFVVQ